MNHANINRAVALQNQANHQIDDLGQASSEVADELESLVDSFTQEEASEFLCVYQICRETHQEDELYIQSEIDFLRNK